MQADSPRFGPRKAWVARYGQSITTLHRIETTDPNAPQPVRLPTGGTLRDFEAWDRYFEKLPRVERTGLAR